MRAKLKSKQTMEMAIANTKADFLLSFTQLKDHQVAPVSNWGIAILKQMTADIMSCKYIAEAQKIAALSAVLPQNANSILYRSAVEEILGYGGSDRVRREQRYRRTLETEFGLFPRHRDQHLAILR